MADRKRGKLRREYIDRRKTAFLFEHGVALGLADVAGLTPSFWWRDHLHLLSASLRYERRLLMLIRKLGLSDRMYLIVKGLTV
jgi:hypothetical protein